MYTRLILKYLKERRNMWQYMNINVSYIILYFKSLTINHMIKTQTIKLIKYVRYIFYI